MDKIIEEALERFKNSNSGHVRFNLFISKIEKYNIKYSDHYVSGGYAATGFVLTFLELTNTIESYKPISFQTLERTKREMPKDRIDEYEEGVEDCKEIYYEYVRIGEITNA